MAKLTDQTEVGGELGKFQTTRWSEIDRAKTPDADQRRLIIDHLIRLYWKPVYCYLRQMGCGNDKAKDLTQGFFHEVVLGQDLIRCADQCRGRFRSFLLTALDHYVSNQFRKERAAKRTLENRFGGISLEAPAGTYIMTAAGSDIWGTSDEFHLTYKELTGAGSVIAKVDSVKNTHHWAKVGVMIRDTLEPDSAHAMAAVTPSRGVNFVRRNAAGVETNTTQETGITAPVWVKIECSVTGYCTASYSFDGSMWTELGAKTIVMEAPMYVGLALTAHGGEETGEAQFSSVQISGTVSPEWANQDIGILSNDPEPMYVALADGGGMVATAYNEDPNATQVGTWMEWNIDLKHFSDQGVNLTDVDRLSVGFGNRDNPQPGGSGKMFLDDIRLTPPPEPEPVALKAHYTFDDGTANDLSGNEFHGTLVGDATVVADDELVLGGSSNVLALDGDGDQVDIPPLGEETMTLTIAMWIKPDQSSLTVAGNHYLFACAANPWISGSLHLLLQNGALKCRIKGEPKAGSAGATLFEADRWYHIAVVRNGTDMIFYVDGQVDGGQPMSRTILLGEGFFLGAFDQTKANLYNFMGRIDDVRVYETALTQAEIQEVMD